MNVQERKEYCLEMANTMMQSIYVSVNQFVVMSWGIKKRIATWFNDMPTLELHVSGCLHKGPVLICYNEGTDYFEIFILDNKRVCKEHIEDVCFDELGQILDQKIERKAGIDDEQYKAEYRKDIEEKLKAS